MIINAPCSHDIASLKELWKEAFGDTDELIDGFFANAYHRERCKAIVENGETSAALYFFDCEYKGNKVAYIYAVATSKKHRGRGLCRRLMEETHEHLKSLGYGAALLVPGSAELFDLYKRLGYRVCSHVDEYTVPASGSSYPLRQINTACYADLRREYLPSNGIIQDGINLEYLSTYAGFYSFSGGVMAARSENGTLHAIELLGDTSRSADITSSLGCSIGNFRTAGGSKPFAMCMDFTGCLDDEVYFGLAFD